jgi:hypothetical protein
MFKSPIFTYGNRGTTKPGVVPEEHAIIYSYGDAPTLLPGEASLSKQPICVFMQQGETPLSRASRIYFGIHHPIQYNVKVKELGDVRPEHLAYLVGYWNMENQADSQQSAMVTSEAFEDSSDQQPRIQTYTASGLSGPLDTSKLISVGLATN